MLFEDLASAAPAGVIPLSVPHFTGNEWKYVKECLDTGWVSSVGPYVDRFERGVASYVGARNAVAVASGTVGLHAALKVIGLLSGEEVIVSNLTFVAPVNAILYCNAFPLLMDVDPETWQIDAEKIESFLVNECEKRGDTCWNRRTGRRVRAILPVHILGLSCEIDRIIDLAREYHLFVVEDAAEAMGVRYRGRHVGTFGDIGVFSFNGNKIVTSGGGGMMVTNNPSYAEYARYLTTQAKDDEIEYVHNEVGYNYRLTNIQAALGVAQLERIDDFVAKKRDIARVYIEGLRDIEEITLMPTPVQMEPTYWLYSILLRESTTLERRKAVIGYLRDNGIDARPFWHVIHELPPYRQCQAFRIEHSIRLHERGISLPSSVGIGKDDLERCIAIVKRSIREIPG